MVSLNLDFSSYSGDAKAFREMIEMLEKLNKEFVWTDLGPEFPKVDENKSGEVKPHDTNTIQANVLKTFRRMLKQQESARDSSL